MVQFMCDVLNERAGAYRSPIRQFTSTSSRGGLRGGGSRGGGGYQNYGQGRMMPMQHPYGVEDPLLTPETLYREFALSAHEMKILAEAVKGLKVRSTHRGAVRVYRVNSLKMVPADELT